MSLDKKIEWQFEARFLDEIRPWKKNPRRITKDKLADLTISLSKFGLAEPIVLNRDGTIIGGHARFLVLKKEGKETAFCAVPNRMLEDKELEELNIRLNKNIAGEFDYDMLANEFDQEDLLEWGFEPEELSITSVPGPENEPKSTNKKPITCPECGHEF